MPFGARRGPIDSAVMSLVLAGVQRDRGGGRWGGRGGAGEVEGREVEGSSAGDLIPRSKQRRRRSHQRRHLSTAGRPVPPLRPLIPLPPQSHTPSHTHSHSPHHCSSANHSAAPNANSHHCGTFPLQLLPSTCCAVVPPLPHALKQKKKGDNSLQLIFFFLPMCLSLFSVLQRWTVQGPI